jgi:hypothetical protein
MSSWSKKLEISPGAVFSDSARVIQKRAASLPPSSSEEKHAPAPRKPKANRIRFGPKTEAEFFHNFSMDYVNAVRDHFAEVRFRLMVCQSRDDMVYPKNPDWENWIPGGWGPDEDALINADDWLEQYMRNEQGLRHECHMLSWCECRRE